MNPKIILNSIQCPDDTILISHTVHDYVVHKDRITNKVYAIDGGNDYLKRVGDTQDCKELSIMSDAPFEIIRENYYRGTYDNDGNRLWVPISKMTKEHLENCIIYNINKGLDEDCFANQMYKKELEYRKNIKDNL
jgi:hypothetical protein